MDQDSKQASSAHRQANQTMLRHALATMSVEQLVEVKSTAHRLKHLPFTRLVNVLFTEAADDRDQLRSEHESPKHNFAGESAEGCRSVFLMDLFDEIERALALSPRADEPDPGERNPG